MLSAPSHVTGGSAKWMLLSSSAHQIHQNLVPDSDNVILLQFGRFELPNCVTRQCRKRRKNLGFILQVRRNDKVQVHCSAVVVSGAHGKATHNHVTRLSRVELAA